MYVLFLFFYFFFFGKGLNILHDYFNGMLVSWKMMAWVQSHVLPVLLWGNDSMALCLGFQSVKWEQ